MKFLFVISSFLTVAVAQQPGLNCSYIYYAGTYLCDLTINNSNGLNNFTEIGGFHLEGFTNADVQNINRVSGVSTNVPSIICDTFPNLDHINLYNTGLTQIDDSAFAGCSLVTQLLLDWNSISTISTNAFVNLPGIQDIRLDRNLLSTLPENVFANQQNLTFLDLSSNTFEDIPVGLFRPLVNLESLYFEYANLSTINNEWFTTNARLNRLELGYNRISLSENSFSGLEGLRYLHLEYNGINEIPAGAFSRLLNLQNLYLSGNNFNELQSDSLAGLANLTYLDLNNNQIAEIHDGAFAGLSSLISLSLQNNALRELNSDTFEGLGNLDTLLLNFNEIEDLPQGIFVPIPNLYYLGLWNNRLKTLRRSSFGTLTSLQTLDLEGNVVNAIDREIIDDAVNLNTLYFYSNLCADNYFGNFQISRAQYLVMLERCFFNFRFIIDTTTQGDYEYSFFEGPHPGIALRVNTDNEAQIALTPFNLLWSPMIEILIGTTNNTRSLIRMNQETDVVTVPTPNIITRGQWNDFRVTWANQVILVYSGNNTFPFMAFTMQYFYPVNFYGLRAIGTSASWTVQPFDL